MGKMSKAFEKSYSAPIGEGGHGKTVSDEKNIRKISTAEESPIPKTPGSEFLFENNNWDERLQMSTDPFSQWFENFRHLRTPILYPTSGVKPRTILVTSIAPHEGKGFICANLGVAIAQDIEHHALIVDCDFRRPSLARYFGLPNETGLVDHLKENIDLSLLIRKTGQKKLSLIPSGKPPSNPSEMLSSNRMNFFIDELAQRYDDRIVLFDSPPSLVASEAGILANYLDGVILVVRHGVSKKAHVKKFVDSIGPNKIIGLVFNAYPENTLESLINKKMGYGYDYGGYYK